MDDEHVDKMWAYRNRIHHEILSKTPVPSSFHKEYRKLCEKMRAWPAELAARLKDAPPIGLHFFVWRELTQPEDFSFVEQDENFDFLREAGHLIRRRMDVPSWDEFQAANEGRVAQAIGGWEKWIKLPGDRRILEVTLEISTLAAGRQSAAAPLP
jgi:hypothetical protein